MAPAKRTPANQQEDTIQKKSMGKWLKKKFPTGEDLDGITNKHMKNFSTSINIENKK